MMPLNNKEILICSFDRGLYRYKEGELHYWDIPANNLFRKLQITSTCSLNNNYFAIGTVQGGVIIIDDEGNVVQHINREKGLQNNTVLKTFSDVAGNIWLGLDNGIDYININSPFTFLKNPDSFGTGYASIIHQGRLYLGTNQGLYVIKWEDLLANKNFNLIPGTYGQVWYLGLHNNVLVCGQNKGTQIIDGGKAVQICDIPGGWKYLILKNHPGFLIGGTYSGPILFKWEKGTWKFVRKIGGFGESFRTFEEAENGDIWMSHGYKGIYRIKLNNRLDSVISVRYYNSDDGLPSNYNLNVCRINDRIVFTSNTMGIYEYVPQDDRFALSESMMKIFSPLAGFSYLKEVFGGNIFYVSDGKAGMFLKRDDLIYEHVTSPFNLLAGRLVNNFEFIYADSGENLLLGVKDGFAHFSPDAEFGAPLDFRTYITEAVVVDRDSIFYQHSITGKAGTDKTPLYVLPYRDNSVSFSYAAPFYDNPGIIDYCYKLEGFQEKWSEWSSSYTHEFSQLHNGRYKFMVKARNQLGQESSTDSIDIQILPPWYKSKLAVIAFIIILISLVILTLWLINKRIELINKREKLRQLREYRLKEQEYIRKALISEKEIISTRNEKLKIEMIQRDKELANQALNLIRKNEFLLKIKEELRILKKETSENPFSEKVITIINRINKEVSHNKQREVFEKAFDEVHESFINRLKSRYPALTPSELRLCAFLKMNISTKEIAPLMNISVRGVEICRYRVRKKLGIERSTNLSGLLINL